MNQEIHSIKCLLEVSSFIVPNNTLWVFIWRNLFWYVQLYGNNDKTEHFGRHL